MALIICTVLFTFMALFISKTFFISMALFINGIFLSAWLFLYVWLFLSVWPFLAVFLTLYEDSFFQWSFLSVWHFVFMAPFFIRVVLFCFNGLFFLLKLNYKTPSHPNRYTFVHRYVGCANIT